MATINGTLNLWCPDWPVSVAGFGPKDLVAVLGRRAG